MLLICYLSAISIITKPSISFLLIKCGSDPAFWSPSFGGVPQAQTRVLGREVLGARGVRFPVKTVKKLKNMKSFALIKPGEFWMGSPVDEFGRNNDETKHLVKISRPFWISKFELTNEEWNANVPPLLQRGNPIFSLNSKVLKKMCVGKNFLDGNYTIGEYEKTGSKKNKLISFFFEEVIPNSGTRGNWELKQENPKSYQLDSQRFLKFYDMDLILLLRDHSNNHVV